MNRLKKLFKSLNNSSDFKRQMRNKRYYMRHRDEIRRKQKEYYDLTRF